MTFFKKVFAIIATLAIALGICHAAPDIPGLRTAAGVLASSSDGMSRYIAPDGPIQPALTAIGGLPILATEQLNQGLSRASLSLHNQAQNLANSAGGNGQVSMPGMESLRNAMPSPIRSLGNQLRSGISAKNNYIRGQADRGIEAGQRLRTHMDGGIEGFARQMEQSGSSASPQLSRGFSSAQNMAEQTAGSAQRQLSSLANQAQSFVSRN